MSTTVVDRQSAAWIEAHSHRRRPLVCRLPSGCRRRRTLLLFGQDDRRLLSPVVRGTAGPAGERGLPPRPEHAERAGFGPCKRCRPDLPTGAHENALVAAACRAIESAEETPALATSRQRRD